jgi:hypothetical protein
MKKILCAILTLVCILALCSCDLIEKFISYDPGSKVTTTTPNKNEAETKEPTDDRIEETTYDNNHSCTTPADENNNGIPDVEEPVDGTTGDVGTDVPTPQTITVTVEWQSGGVVNHKETVTTEASATLSYVYRLFAEKIHGEYFYAEVLSIDGIQINGKWVDASEVIYVQDGDYIYATEWNAELSSHLHVWDGGQCVRCGEACSHDEWHDNVCFFCKFECWHNEWEWNVCATCPFVCTHENIRSDGQCQLCQMYVGADVLNIEIYEDYEEKPYYYQTYATTLRGVILALYPDSLLNKIESEYDFYFNGTPIDSSYLITESGRIDMVKRQ